MMQADGKPFFEDFCVEPWLTIITGHYGVGKTNLCLNIARDMRQVLPKVTLVDLDVVNPYFRTTDNKDYLDAHGIRVLGPVYGASNLDTPSLAPGIDDAIVDARAEHGVIIDVGGDSDGARALGRYGPKIRTRAYRLIYVVNLHRPETVTLEDNISQMKSIEATSGLVATELVGNTHLKEFSSAGDIVAAARPTLAIAQAAGVALSAICAPRDMADEVAAALADDEQLRGIGVYGVDIVVGAPWELAGRVLG